ncbi:TetR/AcrR family transcriptional regulator [Nocardia araoensis]|uniref:TetR/AcrR family transcriptional regulator n=1 Tax=Nocardia araoensis TaxID=228600 RepID=UPI00030B4892|nr:TetR/AcrR family transcriptional regulator C-terminal domain-containing protein [Nocardia araoensis]
MTDELPRVARLLWSGKQPSGRGPRPGLSLDRIVGAAVTVADTEGIGALSMQRVAGELGAATMSLYRHVPSKDDLVVLMLDATMSEPLVLPGDDWRAALELWARRTRELYLHHPWVLAVGTRNRWMGPNEAAWGEAAIAALLGAGMPGPVVGQAVLSVNAFVGGVARLEVDPTLGRGAAGHIGPALHPEMVHRYGQPERYPAMLAMLAAGREDHADSRSIAESVFEFGLGKLLDGIAADLAT